MTGLLPEPKPKALYVEPESFNYKDEEYDWESSHVLGSFNATYTTNPTEGRLPVEDRTYEKICLGPSLMGRVRYPYVYEFIEELSRVGGDSCTLTAPFTCMNALTQSITSKSLANGGGKKMLQFFNGTALWSASQAVELSDVWSFCGKTLLTQPLLEAMLLEHFHSARAECPDKRKPWNIVLEVSRD